MTALDDAVLPAHRKPALKLVENPTGDEFRNAMSRLATAVGVAACWEGTRPAGLLVSSITPLSIEPPRLLFCVQKSTRSHDAFLNATDCSLNVLSDADRNEAERFSRAAHYWERFDPTLWSLDSASPPRLRAALISVQGAIDHRMDAGTHSVFVVNVERVSLGEGGPLIYFDRAYAALRPLAEDEG